MKHLWMPMLLTGLVAPPILAQEVLQLSTLQEAALAADPRARQGDLQGAASELRSRNISAGWLPSISPRGEATYQSEVARIPLEIPGATLATPPLQRYAVSLDVEQLLYDSGVQRSRRAVEAASLGVEHARIEAALHPLRAEVNAAFFTALTLDARIAQAEVLIEDLEARLALVRAQVQDGVALPGDTAALHAERLRAAQSRAEAVAHRRAARSTLAELTGLEIDESDLLELPRLAEEVARVRASSGVDLAARDHPEYVALEAQREQLTRQTALIRTQSRPRAAAFAQIGYGRPGYEQFAGDFHEFWMAGVRLHWQPWDWGTRSRERDELELRQQVIRTEEEALTARLHRQGTDLLATIDHLEQALEVDDQIILLREQVERQARAQLTERAITPAEYITIRADLQSARLTQQQHQIDLEWARASYLTLLGVNP